MALGLYDHQLDAIGRMHNGCILVGDVGSGKSRTGAGFYYQRYGGDLRSDHYVKMVSPADLYIITTPHKRDSREWEGDLLPFLIFPDPHLKVYNHEVFIDSWNNIDKYANVKGAFFIFDEQRVVGYGPWAKAFIEIAKNNEWIMLSATPGDSFEDYMSVFIANGYYRNKTHFVQEHIVYKPFTRYPQISHFVNVGRLMRLRERVLVDMEDQRKTVPHDLDVLVQYDKDKYRWVLDQRKDPETRKPLRNASDLCSTLRRIANSDVSRSEKLLWILGDHPRAIVFYNYDYELEILKSLNYREGTVVAEWNGHKHEPIPKTERWVYLVQYNAGAEGWNCIATDTMVFYSQNYSYRIMHQAAGRINRMNTQYVDLYYYHLKSNAPIDLAIQRAIAKKKRFNEGRFYERIPQKVVKAA